MITEINNQTNLSEHFKLAELCKTKTGMENVPNEEQVNNLKRLCGWLEQLRLRYNQMRNEKGEMRTIGRRPKGKSNGNEEMRN